jgi:hypothetical protein
VNPRLACRIGQRASALAKAGFAQVSQGGCPYPFASVHQLGKLVLLLPLDEVIDYVAGVSADGEQRV